MGGFPTQKELTHFRDDSYSAWHRTESISRYIGKVQAAKLSMIDLDVMLWVEANQKRIPVVLIETAQDIGQSHKCAQITKNLAEMAGIPALVVLYKKAHKKNPADSSIDDIESFRVKRICPNTQQEWKIYSPQEYAEELVSMRDWSWDRVKAEE